MFSQWLTDGNQSLDHSCTLLIVLYCIVSMMTMASINDTRTFRFDYPKQLPQSLI